MNSDYLHSQIVTSTFDVLLKWPFDVPWVVSLYSIPQHGKQRFVVRRELHCAVCTITLQLDWCVLSRAAQCNLSQNEPSFCGVGIFSSQQCS